jgi:hypothetical protein
MHIKTKEKVNMGNIIITIIGLSTLAAGLYSVAFMAGMI